MTPQSKLDFLESSSKQLSVGLIDHMRERLSAFVFTDGVLDGLSKELVTGIIRREGGREGERQTDRLTDRQTDRQRIVFLLELPP